jgi:hypothetical protein
MSVLLLVGLLHLGDRRVCTLLWSLRTQLGVSAVDEAIKCSTGFLYGASVEFEIDWLEEMDARRLIGDDPTSSGDWGRELSYQRTSDSDFFGRAGSEIRSTYEELKKEANRDWNDQKSEYVHFIEVRYSHLPAFSDAVFPIFQSAGLSNELYEEWWRTVSEPEFKKASFGSLAAMWRGAASTLSPEMSGKVVPFETVVQFLPNYRLSL